MQNKTFSSFLLYISVVFSISFLYCFLLFCEINVVIMMHLLFVQLAFHTTFVSSFFKHLLVNLWSQSRTNHFSVFVGFLFTLTEDPWHTEHGEGNEYRWKRLIYCVWCAIVQNALLTTVSIFSFPPAVWSWWEGSLYYYIPWD